jgi:predicted anti-sigma-YlaC factor YlaD
MSCGWSLEIDLAAALRERRDPRWSAFHAHHPACPDCRRALAPWTRLDALVRAATRELPEWHPPDEALIALLERPRSQTPAERARVAAHLDACGPCRDALLAVAALP